MAMSEWVQVAIVSDHFKRHGRETRSLCGPARPRDHPHVAHPPLCRMSEVLHSIHRFFQSLSQWFLPHNHGWLSGRICTALFLQPSLRDEPMEGSEGLRGVEEGL